MISRSRGYFLPVEDSENDTCTNVLPVLSYFMIKNKQPTAIFAVGCHFYINFCPLNQQARR